MDDIKQANISIIGVSREERDKGAEKSIAENSPNLGKERHPGSGNTNISKQDEPKQVHTTPYYNEKVKG